MNNKKLLIELYKHPLVQQMLIKELLTKRQLVELVLLESHKITEGPFSDFNKQFEDPPPDDERNVDYPGVDVRDEADELKNKHYRPQWNNRKLLKFLNFKEIPLAKYKPGDSFSDEAYDLAQKEFAKEAKKKVKKIKIPEATESEFHEQFEEEKESVKTALVNQWSEGNVGYDDETNKTEKRIYQPIIYNMAEFEPQVLGEFLQPIAEEFPDANELPPSIAYMVLLYKIANSKWKSVSKPALRKIDIATELSKEPEEITETEEPTEPEETVNFVKFLMRDAKDKEGNDLRMRNSSDAAKISELYFEPLHSALKARQKKYMGPELDGGEEEGRFKFRGDRLAADSGKGEAIDKATSSDELKKLVPFAINKSARLEKALEKMVSFLEKDALQDTDRPMLGEPPPEPEMGTVSEGIIAEADPPAPEEDEALDVEAEETDEEVSDEKGHEKEDHKVTRRILQNDALQIGSAILKSAINSLKKEGWPSAYIEIFEGLIEETELTEYKELKELDKIPRLLISLGEMTEIFRERLSDVARQLYKFRGTTAGDKRSYAKTYVDKLMKAYDADEKLGDLAVEMIKDEINLNHNKNYEKVQDLIGSEKILKQAVMYVRDYIRPANATVPLQEELTPPLKNRTEIRDVLKAEIQIQKDYSEILQFYYENFMKQQDKLKTDVGFVKNAARKIMKVFLDTKEWIGSKTTLDKYFDMRRDWVGDIEELKAAYEAVEAAETEEEISKAMRYLLEDKLPTAIKSGWERLQRVYSETKTILKDLKQGKFELSSELSAVIQDILGETEPVKQWFAKQVELIDNNEELPDNVVNIFKQIGESSDDVKGIGSEEPEEREVAESILREEVSDPQRQFLIDWKTFANPTNGHKTHLAKGIRGMSDNMDTVDQRNYFKFFGLARAIVKKAETYNENQTKIVDFLRGLENIPEYIKLRDTVVKKEKLRSPKGGSMLKYAQYIADSIPRQDELKIEFESQATGSAEGGFDSKDAADLASMAGTAIDVITVGAFVFPPLAPLAAALKMPKNFVTIGEAALHAKTGNNAKAAAALIGIIPLADKISADWLLKIPGMNGMITKLGAAVGKEMTEEMVQQVVKKGAEAAIKGATVKAAETIDKTDPEAAKVEAKSLFGDIMDKLTGGTDEPEEGDTKAEILDLENRLRTVAGKTKYPDIRDSINKILSDKGDDGSYKNAGDTPDQQLAALEAFAKRLKAPEKSDGDEPPDAAQEQIERALKPIIEQLLRGKHGKKELYY